MFILMLGLLTATAFISLKTTSNAKPVLVPVRVRAK